MPRTRFGQEIRQQLDGRGLSIRKFARLLDPAQPERGRRNLTRWISGGLQPTRLNRIAVAHALGLPDDHFLGDEDEEDDPVVALMSAIRRVVRDEIEARA